MPRNKYLPKTRHTHHNRFLLHQSVHAHKHLHTPMPSYEELKKYDSLSPGFAETILKEYPQTIQHVRKMDLIMHKCMQWISISNLIVPIVKYLFGFASICIIVYMFLKSPLGQNPAIGIPISLSSLIGIIVMLFRRSKN